VCMYVGFIKEWKACGLLTCTHDRPVFFMNGHHHIGIFCKYTPKCNIENGHDTRTRAWQFTQWTEEFMFDNL
jgi:hypothetical protein